MPYAEGATFYDADSHIMESPSWLGSYADPAVRDKLRPFTTIAGADSPVGKMIEGVITKARERISDPEATRKLEEDVMRSAKGWGAHGAMDPAERTRTLDLLGFEQQLVFTTFSIGQFMRAKDMNVVYGGARAHNRGMTEFCRNDRRLSPVGFVPLADPKRAVEELEEALKLGCESIWVPTDAPDFFSPAHSDLDPFYARLAEARVPMLLHIGGAKILAKRYHNNGRAVPTDWLGGGENLRSKDFPVLHHSPERFLSCLVLDGVFMRNPELRCGVIEQGASWVPGLLRNLDYALRSFKRNEPLLQELDLLPSEYIRRQVRFTPFPFEDVGWLVEQAGEELFLFSSDYPHPEGGKDPIGRFEASVDEHGIGADARRKFYSENYAELMRL